MKKKWILPLSAATALFILIGYAFTPSAAAGSLPDTTVSEYALLTDTDTSVSDRDASGEYDASKAVSLSPSDDLTIREAGVYILSGVYKDVMIVIDAGEEDKVQLVLDNAELSNENGPAVYVRSADKVFITAAEGTENTISDGADYTLTDEETTLDAAVFSKDDLTINGAGKLTITGNYKHAVVSKDDLVVTAGDLAVSAENIGLSGKDSVKLYETSVTITAGTDGIRSENGAEEGKGFVSAVNSTVTITSGKDGIQAETDFLSENSELTVTAGGGSEARSADASESFKGIKAGSTLTISGGSFQINALDDGLHTDGSLLIAGGDLLIRSGDDAVHANEKAEIADGTLNLTAREGIEATYTLISGGDITIQATDDGINAARKSSVQTPAVEITGGAVTITMGSGDTDGIDSNGNIIITGGTVRVSGNSPFDYDGSVTFTGGTVYVNGQQVSSLPNQMMGGGTGGFFGQGGFGGDFGNQSVPGGGFGDQGGFGGRGRH